MSIPTLYIVVQFLRGPGESWAHFAQYLLPIYLRNSLYLLLACGVLTILIGVGTAWISTRYEFPLRRSLEWLLILPLAIPSYITAFAYAGVFDYGGSLELLARGLGLEMPKLDIMNIYGLIFILSVSLYPYVYVACRAFFMHQSQNLLEAAQVLGDSERRSFFRLILPISRPAIVGGVVLVAMEVLNDYGAAKYYGINTFTTGIFKSWLDYQEPITAVYLAALLLVIIFGLLLWEQLQQGRKRYTSGTKDRKRLVRIRPRSTRRCFFTLLVALPVILGFIIPVAQLIYWAFLAFDVINWSDIFTMVWHSLTIATLAAACCVCFAVALLFTSQWNHLRSINKLAKFGVLGYAIPGAVIAVGVYVPSLFFEKWLIGVVKTTFSFKIGLFLTGTTVALVYAYMVRFLAVAHNPIAAGKQKIQATLSEASQSLGKNPVATFFKIELPLLRTALLSAFILVFIDVMKELPLTLILKPFYLKTLAVEAYQYASDERVIESAFPALMIILTGVLPVIFLNRLVRQD